MTTPLIPRPDVMPRPDIAPSPSPGADPGDTDLIGDAAIMAMIDQAQAEMYVGVVLGPPGKIYCYIGLPGCDVGSMVLVPANSFSSTPGKGEVVTLNPPIPPGIAIKRILAILS